MNLEGLNPQEIVAKVNEVVSVLNEIRSTVNAYLKAAIAAGTFTDALALIEPFTAAVATGGKDPADILACIQGVIKVNADLDAAVAAVKAQGPEA